jgi:glycosyl transferase family 25
MTIQRPSIKTYIVHLTRAEQRGKHIVAEAEKHNIDYEIIHARDCLDLSDDDYKEFCDVEAMRKSPEILTPGLVCASYTHYMAYEKILEDGVDFALIIEDDVVLPEGINDLLYRVAENMTKDEVVLLHYLSFDTIRLQNDSAQRLSDRYRLMQALSSARTVSAAGYVLSSEMAQAMSDFVLPIRFSTDAWGRFQSEGPVRRVRYVYPMAIESAGFKSTVQALVQNKLRAKLTTFIDDHKVPPFYGILRGMRKRAMQNMASIVVE